MRRASSAKYGAARSFPDQTELLLCIGLSRLQRRIRKKIHAAQIVRSETGSKPTVDRLRGKPRTPGRGQERGRQSHPLARRLLLLDVLPYNGDEYAAAAAGDARR